MASCTGGCVENAIHPMSTIITVPNTLAVISRAPPILGDANKAIPTIPLIAAAVVASIPNMICNPMEAPPILPILNAKPPRAIKNATTYPSPGKILLAISCPLMRETLIIVHTFN